MSSSIVDRFNSASSLTVMLGTLGVTAGSYLLYRSITNSRGMFFDIIHFNFLVNNAWVIFRINWLFD